MGGYPKPLVLTAPTARVTTRVVAGTRSGKTSSEAANINKDRRAMNATLRLGRIGGVRVGLHWSVLGIVLVLVVALGFAQWPRQLPGYPIGAYLIAATITAALFVASLLAHELAHAFVAKREGVEVGDITLWLLGGVARLRGEARSPGSELRIAGVGPAVSILAGLLFGLFAWVAYTNAVGPLATAVLGYLSVINIVLAVFNLIPAAPLDGGRILRSALWARWGDRHRATVWSARAGRVFGLLLIGYGIVRLLLGPFGSGVWWILIACSWSTWPPRKNVRPNWAPCSRGSA